MTSDKVRSVDGGEPSLRPSLQPPLWKLVGASISPSAVRRQALNKGREKPKAKQRSSRWTRGSSTARRAQRTQLHAVLRKERAAPPELQ